jgi:hypothetical protein
MLLMPKVVNCSSVGEMIVSIAISAHMRLGQRRLPKEA